MPGGFWGDFSSEVVLGLVSLMGRAGWWALVFKTHPIQVCSLGAGNLNSITVLVKAELLLRGWCPGGVPQKACDWEHLFKTMWETTRKLMGLGYNVYAHSTGLGATSKVFARGYRPETGAAARLQRETWVSHNAARGARVMD